MADALLPIARKIITTVDPDTIPVYGSTGFLDTDVNDPAWLASVVRAAECWRLHHGPDQVAQRLDDDNRVCARRIRLASYDVSTEPMPKPGPWPADAGVPAGFYPPKESR